MNTIKKIASVALLMLVCATSSKAGTYLLQTANGSPYRADVIVQIWDTTMMLHTQFNLSGPRLVFDGYQYPGAGPFTMIIFAGNKEVWRGRVGKSDEDRVIQI